MLSRREVRNIFSLAYDIGWSMADVVTSVNKNFHKPIRRLESNEYREFCDMLKTGHRTRAKNEPTERAKNIRYLTYADGNKFFDEKEAAQELGLTVSAIRSYLSLGRLTIYKFKSLNLLSRAEVSNYLKNYTRHFLVSK